MGRRIMLLVAAAAMVAAMFVATPAMAQGWWVPDGDADDFWAGPFTTTTPFVDDGCFTFGCGFVGDFNDFEHVGPLHHEDGLLCAHVREGFDRFLECYNPKTGETITF